MKATVVQSFEAVSEQRPTVLAIGNFDGVHQGHQALLKQVVDSAETHKARPAALTFLPHPREIIQGRTDPFYLSRFEERFERIAEQGIELIIAHPFNEAVRNTRAADFVDAMVTHLDLKQLWGGNFSLGYRREGDFDYLTQAGTERGFSVHLFEPIIALDGKVSSTEIRQLLRNASVEDAARLLTRPYSVSGAVVYGRQLGRTIGVPTANIGVWEKQLLPAHGVYATRIHIDGAIYMAATNVGVRPTVDGDARVSVEAHILDFAGDIYGKQVQLDFVAHVRAEQKFDGLEALKAQISADIQKVQQLLSK